MRSLFYSDVYVSQPHVSAEASAGLSGWNWLDMPASLKHESSVGRLQEWNFGKRKLLSNAQFFGCLSRFNGGCSLSARVLRRLPVELTCL